jgi:hypothetical protein
MAYRHVTPAEGSIKPWHLKICCDGRVVCCAVPQAWQDDDTALRLLLGCAWSAVARGIGA